MDIEKEFADLKLVIKDAGKIAREYFTEDSTQNEVKPDGSVVTEIDKKIETILVNHIRDKFPDDSIVGEEQGNHTGTSGYVWHIDPIDGTDNFLRKIPFCAVSVARLGDSQEDSFAVVYNPLTEQMFASLMEDEVYENERIRTLTKDTLGSRMILSIGAGSGETWMKGTYIGLQKGIISELGGRCRAYNCTALELAYVAANRIDAYFTVGLKSYDYAAGFFLIKATGGRISVYENGSWKLHTGSIKELCSEHGKIILASHPDIHEQLVHFIGDPKCWSEGNC